MNLIRNHIIYGYRLLDELENRPVQLDMFGDHLSLAHGRRPIPVEMPDDFMANLEKIIARAKKLIEKLRASGDGKESQDAVYMSGLIERKEYVHLRQMVYRYTT